VHREGEWMKSSELLTDAFGRVGEVVHAVLVDITPEQLAYQVKPGSNSIAWLVWHLSRVIDDHLAAASERISGSAYPSQVWKAGGYLERFSLPFQPDATGYGQGAGEVAALGSVPALLLLEYYDAVSRQAIEFLDGVRDEDLGRIVDSSWNPPVTLAVRLVSVLSDALQHAGQAAFLRGIAGLSLTGSETAG